MTRKEADMSDTYLPGDTRQRIKDLIKPLQIKKPANIRIFPNVHRQGDDSLYIYNLLIILISIMEQQTGIHLPLFFRIPCFMPRQSKGADHPPPFRYPRCQSSPPAHSPRSETGTPGASVPDGYSLPQDTAGQEVR